MYQQEESPTILLTLAEYQALEAASERKWEYLDGEAWCLAGGSNTYSTICANSIRELGNAVRKRGKGCIVHTSDAKVELARTRYLYPDVTVSCDARDREQDAFLRYPRVVCEVLSPSTQSKDHGPKLMAYQALTHCKRLSSFPPDRCVWNAIIARQRGATCGRMKLLPGPMGS
jgi:Uma2 family endonuclease